MPNATIANKTNNNNNNNNTKCAVRPPTPSRSKSPINRAPTARQRSASRDASSARKVAAASPTKSLACSPPKSTTTPNMPAATNFITSRPGFPGKEAMGVQAPIIATSTKKPTSPPKASTNNTKTKSSSTDIKKPIVEKSVIETKQPATNTKVTVEKCTVTTKIDGGKTTVVTETTKKTEVVEIANVEVTLPTPKDYPDSDEEVEGQSPKRKSSSLQYGTISNWQAENLELLYARANKFPTADDVKEFSEKYNIPLIDIEIWLETRRELTYKKYCEQGKETEPSVMQFYSEAMKMAEGIRLEQPAIRSKAFFSLNGISEIEAKKEQEDKEVPSLQISTNKLYLVPNREDKSQLTFKNTGQVNIVYQVFVSNSDLYIMSPTCAILHPDEELTLNIVRKPGPIGANEFFRVDYGRNPDGLIDAREAADRAEMDAREIVEIVDLDEQDMKVAR